MQTIESRKISKAELAQAIAKSYMDCQKRLSVPSRLEAARNELLNLAMLLSVYHLTVKILKNEYGVKLVFAGKAE